MDINQTRVLRDDNAHRRGLVLGLTMAEIMVMILFMLLLLLAALDNHHREELAKTQLTIRDQSELISQFVLVQEKLADIAAHNPAGVTVDDILQQIKREHDANERLKEKIIRLEPFEATAKTLETIMQGLAGKGEATPTASQIVEQIQQMARLIKENETLKGQNTQLSRQIRVTGRGNEFPSCWVTPDGRIESIFELWINEVGIRIIDRTPFHRLGEREKLPLSEIRYDTNLDRYEFETAVRPLYQWSIDHQCRFYVMIASSERTAPIHLVNAINGYFYPSSKIQLRPTVR